MIDLKAKPFYLDDEGVRWVEDTLKSMSTEDKVGQLFCDILWDKPGSDPLKLFDNVQIGGFMYRPFPGKRMNEVSRELQSKARIPLLIACNLER